MCVSQVMFRDVVKKKRKTDFASVWAKLAFGSNVVNMRWPQGALDWRDNKKPISGES